ncbi:hypothetical protein HanIR_Chr01g0015311 [Helianthus annuus]|nr:hypothetical protein HanIR_Chr01g0015311 [Helianthus annuus]
MLNSMSDLSDTLQNLNLYPVRIEVSRDFNRYIAEREEPIEFNAVPLEKPTPKKIEIGESSRQIEGLPSQEEFDFSLTDYNSIKSVNEKQLVIDVEPAIPNPSIHPQPLGIDEWLTNEIQIQNYPYKLFPQYDPEPNPPISNREYS